MAVTGKACGVSDVILVTNQTTSEAHAQETGCQTQSVWQRQSSNCLTGQQVCVTGSLKHNDKGDGQCIAFIASIITGEESLKMWTRASCTPYMGV